MREITIKAPAGRVVTCDAETGVVLFVGEKKAVKAWEELNTVNGYYVSTDAEIYKSNDATAHKTNTNVYPTIEFALASIAQAMLLQLYKQFGEAYFDGWIPNWTYDDDKYVIVLETNTGFCVNLDKRVNRLFTFPTKKLASEFLLLHKDLFKKYKPLMGGV